MLEVVVLGMTRLVGNGPTREGCKNCPPSIDGVEIALVTRVRN